jgi:hypothetical protein
MSATEPSWGDVLPMLLDAVQYGGPVARKTAMQELRMMALAADLWAARNFPPVLKPTEH